MGFTGAAADAAQKPGPSPEGSAISHLLALLQAHAPQLPATDAALRAGAAPFQQLGQDMQANYARTTARATAPLPGLADLGRYTMADLSAAGGLARDAGAVSISPLMALTAGLRQALYQNGPLPFRNSGAPPTPYGLTPFTR